MLVRVHSAGSPAMAFELVAYGRQVFEKLHLLQKVAKRLWPEKPYVVYFTEMQVRIMYIGSSA